uniref:NADH-ubiquinone oxidoreductase chain 6 n=1 Tax=Sicista concolor TaxID=1170369 RepID=A0A0H3UCC9_9RODE|nr:NADH dehydrogenase subunit 6 [Sicista concolor]AIG99678.1 NADH dehydrogenase subunit 6 [Sicista concolor]
MTTIMIMLSLLFVACFIGFAVKPSPIYGGVCLIVGGGLGCGMILGHGGSYMGLMVFLIYLGGMMVVFGYTTAMAAESYPETWVSGVGILVAVLGGLLAELGLVMWLVGLGMEEGIMDYSSLGEWVIYDSEGGGYMSEDMIGVSAMYSCGSWLMVVAGWSLFVSVFIVMEIVRGN